MLLHCLVTRSDMIPTTNMNTLHCAGGKHQHSQTPDIFISPNLTQGVGERARVFETLNFFKRPDVVVSCAFSGNIIAYSCSMSATGAPSKALKVRTPAAKHYQLRHRCTLPNSLIL